MPLAALTPAAPSQRVQARQVRSAGPAVPGAPRAGHGDGCRCSEAQGRAFRAREASVRTPCAPLGGLMRGLRALAAELGGCASAEREIAGLGPGRGRERQQSVTMEGSGGHFMKFATLGALSRPRHHCEANQLAPSLGRGPGTRVRRRTRRPGATLPGPPSSRLHACDQREGQRGQREPPVPQAARLHTQRCPQPRAAGAPPATRRAMGGGCAVVPAARRRWGSLVHPWGWSEANLPQGSRWF